MEALCAIMCGGANARPDAARLFADAICSARVHQPLLTLIAAQPQTHAAVKARALGPSINPLVCPFFLGVHLGVLGLDILLSRTHSYLLLNN